MIEGRVPLDRVRVEEDEFLGLLFLDYGIASVNLVRQRNHPADYPQFILSASERRDSRQRVLLSKSWYTNIPG